VSASEFSSVSVSVIRMLPQPYYVDLIEHYVHNVIMTVPILYEHVHDWMIRRSRITLIMDD
jgi:hypothetical protein